MGRLILVPQYPSRLRYQEWWVLVFLEQYSKRFDDVLVLGPVVNSKNAEKANVVDFSPIATAVDYELKQISEFMSLELKKDDTLLLNDLSFPGLFAHALLHKRPRKCFAICHATSKNHHDLFQPLRRIKYPVEKSIAKLFDKIFVGSQYHAKKLGWDNIEVTRLPNYPVWMRPKVLSKDKIRFLSCASRPNIQKTTKRIEHKLELRFGTQIARPNATSWEGYFRFLQESKYLIITSKEETYGYQVIDALMNGCIPLAPRKFSYPELLPDKFLYSDYTELVSKINAWREYTPLLELPKEDFFNLTTKIMQGKTNE